jgi:hypothetical protein
MTKILNLFVVLTRATIQNIFFLKLDILLLRNNILFPRLLFGHDILSIL